jgi:hypothetical protein
MIAVFETIAAAPPGFLDETFFPEGAAAKAMVQN